MGGLVKPRLQMALDVTTLPEALRPLNRAIDQIDVIECGTVLIIAEGLRAVQEIRALYPDKPILADIRIAEAGKILSQMAFEAGATLVSVVAGASMNTVRQVVAVANDYGGEVQVELADEWYDADKAREWARIGVKHVIVKRSRDREAAGDLSWGSEDIARVDELAAMGLTVTITGGIKVKDLDTFAGHPVGIVIAGRSVVGAQDPRQAATELQDKLREVWS